MCKNAFILFSGCFLFFIVVLLNETVNFLIFFVGFRGFLLLGYLKEYCKCSNNSNRIITISPFNEKNKRNLNKKRIRKKEKYLYNVYMAYETGGCCGVGSIVLLYYFFGGGVVFFLFVVGGGGIGLFGFVCCFVGLVVLEVLCSVVGFRIC